MIRTAIKGLAANRVRMILTGLSIVLGVAFVAGSFVFNGHHQRPFRKPLHRLLRRG